VAILTLVIAGLVTWSMRASFIALGDRVTLGPFAERVVQNARHATMAALVAGALAAAAGSGPLPLPLPWVPAAAAAAFAATRTRNLGLIVAAGMGTLWLVKLALALA
jgi:branched-subunit amino acid transport protein